MAPPESRPESARVLPSLFIGHGAPTLILDDVPARDFLKGLGTTLARPRAILAVSAHWLTDKPAIGASAQPETIHDFYGFPEPLYQQRYPVPGDPGLAARVQELLKRGGFEADLDPTRGLDHGIWSPLQLTWPEADIPIVPLSVQPGLGPQHHLAMGRALAPLRHDGVLILGSGNATHDLTGFRGSALDAPALDYAADFDDWLAARITSGSADDLLHYRERGPHAVRNHPTEDHILPLFVAYGAGGQSGAALHRSITYGAISMAAYAFPALGS